MIEKTATFEGGAMGARLLDFQSIPVIDIAPLSASSRSAFEATATQIGKACREVGFFYIRNHGVPQSLIDGTYALSRVPHLAGGAPAVGAPEELARHPRMGSFKHGLRGSRSGTLSPGAAEGLGA